MRLRWLRATALLSAALLLGCADESTGPVVRLGAAFTPGTVCNADPTLGDPSNGAVETRVLFGSEGDAGVFSPLPVQRVAGDAGLELPAVSLTGAGAGASPVGLAQTEYLSPAQLALWVTRTSGNGAPLAPGRYSVTVRNPNGSTATVADALRVVPPPVLEAARRVDPPVPAMPAAMDEARVVCNAHTTRLLLTGQNFRPGPEDPPPIVTLVSMADPSTPLAGYVAGVLVRSATELELTLEAPTDPARRLAPGTYGFRIVNPDGTPSGSDFPQGCRHTRPDLITVVPPPEVRSVEPVAACSSVGTMFVVRGANLRPGLSLTIDASPTPYTVPAAMLALSSSTMSPTSFDTATFTVPAGSVAPGGPYALTVRHTDGCFATYAPSCPAGTMPVDGSATDCNGTVTAGSMGTGPRSLRFYPDPTITALAPMAVCSGAGQPVTITGTGFHSTYGVAPTVTIRTGVSTVALEGVTVASDTMLTGTVPAPGLAPGGPYDVTVTLPERCGATRAMALSVVPGPTASAVLPSRGWNMIDMPVSVLGDGFAGVTAALLRGAGPGGADLPLRDVVVVDPTLLNATIPAGAVAGGPYDLVLRTMGGCDVVLPRAYTVQAEPSLTVSRVVPPFGWTMGTTAITITGDRFASTPRVFLVVPSRTPRLVALRRVVFVNDRTLTALAPAGLPVGGPYDLVVINPDGGGGLLSMAFRVTAEPPPRLTRITPDQGTTQGPTMVTLEGSHFRGTPAITFTNAAGMSFNATGVAVTGTGESTRATGTAPSNTMPPGAYLVRLENADERTYDELGAFVVTNPSANLGAFADAAMARLNTPRKMLGAASGRIDAANRFLYAVGGDNAGAALDTVEVAQLDLLGRLTPWYVQRYRLRAPRTRLGVVRQGSFLYAVGGASDGAAPMASVERAKILDFSDAPVLADPMVRRVPRGPGLAAGAWIYRVAAVKDPAMDSANPGGETLPSDEVTAVLLSTSTVTLSWMPVPGARGYRVYRTPMVNGASGGAVLLADNVTATTFTDDASAMPGTETPLRPGSTGVWISEGVPALAHARSGAAVLLAPSPSGARSFVYALGGEGVCPGQGAAGPMGCYEYLELDPVTGRHVGAWTAGPSAMPTRRWFPAGAVATAETARALTAGPTVYVVGGFVPRTMGGMGMALEASGTLDRAPVTEAGALGTFVTESRFPNRGGASSTVANGQLFALGGTQGAGPTTGPFSPATRSAVLQPSGAVDNSNNSSALLQSNGFHALVREAPYFYVLGGSTTGADALASVQQASF